MKICTKRIYCSNCRRLVKGREQGDSEKLQVSCSRCGKPIYVWDGITWRYT